MMMGFVCDGGLYLFEIILIFLVDDIVVFEGLFYEEVVLWVVMLFVGDSFMQDELKGVILCVYVGFDYVVCVLMVQFVLGYFLLELFYGLMLVFKDFVMQLIGQLFQLVLVKFGQWVVIFGVILGDIGLVVIEVFWGLFNVDVFIMYLYGCVSEVQCCQMLMFVDVNVYVLVVDGIFDDCQVCLKDLFNDYDFCDGVGLVGVNLINWVWVLVQIVYYFIVVVLVGGLLCQVDFIVFMGNFGDIFVGLIVKVMGLLVGKLVVVINQNDILYCVLLIGEYCVGMVEFLISLLMDIQVSLNFECVLWLVYGQDGVVVMQLMDELKFGGFSISQGVLEVLWEIFVLGCVFEVEMVQIIVIIYVEIVEVICLYIVVVVKIVCEYQCFGVLMISLLIVYLVKFFDVVEVVIGICLVLFVYMVDLFDKFECII